MFLSRFRRRKSAIVERVEAYTTPQPTVHPDAAGMHREIDRRAGPGDVFEAFGRMTDQSSGPPELRPIVTNVVITPPSGTVPYAMAARFKQELKRHRVPSAGERKYTTVTFPPTVEGCLLADQFEHQLKRRGLQ